MQAMELRVLIREVLQEEIGKLKSAAGNQPRQAAEMVSLTSDSDLNAFARKVAAMCADATARRRILDSQIHFALSGEAGANQSRAASDRVRTATGAAVATFEKGLLNEKIIDTLPEGTRVINCGRRVHFTPLARDRIRQRGITLKRQNHD